VATTSTETAAQSVLLQYTLDDWRTSLEIPFTKADLYWDTLSWGWLQRWQLKLPAQPEETLLRYQVFAQQPATSSAEGEAVRCYD